MLQKRKKKTSGLPPGSIIYTGKKTDLPIYVNYIEYDKDECKEITKKKKHEVILSPSNDDLIQWYDIRGLHDTELIREIGNIFSMHPIITEDIVDIYQRPKHIEYDNGHFIHFKTLHYNQEVDVIQSQAISIFFGQSFVITFQEHENDIFSPMRDRIKNAKGRIRSKKADYLANSIVDFIVDQYYEVIEEVEARIDQLEEMIALDVELIKKHDIYDLKKKLNKFRRNVYPLREAINQFSRTDSEMVSEVNKIYIRDVYDHIIQIMDTIDNHRDILSGLQDLYLSELSMKMNKVMQFLTIVTAIFVPLSFLAGLYGMNFQYIPELGFKYGYFILITVMIIIAIAMIYVFSRKKWL